MFHRPSVTPLKPPDTRMISSKVAEVCPALRWARTLAASAATAMTVRAARRETVTSGCHRPRVVYALEQDQADDEENGNQEEAGTLIATEHKRGTPE